MKNPPDKRQKTADYYNLHTGAVEDLVSASKENTPHYSRQELEKYRSSKRKWRMPQALKAVLIKFWFYGAVCFFVFMGLGMYVGNQLDMLFIAAIIMGMVTDLLINHFLRFTEKLPGGSAKWMMVTRRGAAGFLMNLVYGFVLLALVVTVYSAINAGLSALYAYADNAPTISVEPILFGLLSTGADMLCLGIRNTLKAIITDAQRK